MCVSNIKEGVKTLVTHIHTHSNSVKVGSRVGNHLNCVRITYSDSTRLHWVDNSACLMCNLIMLSVLLTCVSGSVVHACVCFFTFKDPSGNIDSKLWPVSSHVLLS